MILLITILLRQYALITVISNIVRNVIFVLNDHFSTARINGQPNIRYPYKRRSTQLVRLDWFGLSRNIVRDKQLCLQD